MNTFPGFTPAALALLNELGTADRDWFRAHRAEYEELLLGPTRALVESLAEPLHAAVSPGLECVPTVNGSIAPLANDTRFVRTQPYKDFLLLRFWEGREKRESPTVFLRIDSAQVGFGCGISLAGRTDRFRAAVAGPEGAVLTELIAGVRPHAEVVGGELRRVPQPWSDDHPRADLLRHRDWLHVRWAEPVPAAVGGPRFVPWAARRLARTAGVHAWLRDNL